MQMVGKVLEDKYEILKEIGRGGMSIVYLAMDKRLNKQWAIKQIKREKGNPTNRIVVQSAIDEANLIKRLDHPMLARIVDIIDTEEAIFIVMDYVEGEPLSKILSNQGAQPQEAVVEWALQLVDVLNYLHTRVPPVVYRDMKPANVMLRPDGSLKLIDFGIAREYKSGNVEDTTILGTRGYAAPEQYGGMGQTDARTDIYCLGATLYHLVTGKNPAEEPYTIEPIRTINPTLSSGLEDIILRCTKSNPNERYQDCEELRYDLMRYEQMDHEYIHAQQTTLKKFIVVAVLAVVFALLGVGALGMRSLTLTSDYNNIIKEAETTANEGDAATTLKHVVKALDIKPGSEEAWLLLSREVVSKSNDGFSQAMEEALSKRRAVFRKELKNDVLYGKICVITGVNVWQYYHDDVAGDATSPEARFKKAWKWFSEARSCLEPYVTVKNVAGEGDTEINRRDGEWEKDSLNYYDLTCILDNLNEIDNKNPLESISDTRYELLKQDIEYVLSFDIKVKNTMSFDSTQSSAQDSMFDGFIAVVPLKVLLYQVFADELVSSYTTLTYMNKDNKQLFTETEISDIIKGIENDLDVIENETDYTSIEMEPSALDERVQALRDTIKEIKGLISKSENKKAKED